MRTLVRRGLANALELMQSATDADFLVCYFTDKCTGVATKYVKGCPVKGRGGGAVKVTHLAVGPFPATSVCDAHTIHSLNGLTAECNST